MDDGHQTEIIFALRSASLFADLRADELLPMAEIAEWRVLPAGAMLYAEGDVAKEMFVIASGQVEILRKGQRLAVVAEGEYFGEVALLARSRRPATARAKSPVTVVATAQEPFEELIELYPVIGRRIAQVLAQRVRQQLSHDPSAGTSDVVAQHADEAAERRGLQGE